MPNEHEELFNQVRDNLKNVSDNFNYSLLVNPMDSYPVVYTVNQDGSKNFKPQYLLGKDLTEPQIKYLYQSGYFKNI